MKKLNARLVENKVVTLRDYGFGFLCDYFELLRIEIRNKKSIWKDNQDKRIIKQFKLSEFK